MATRPVDARDRTPYAEGETPRELRRIFIATRGPIAVEAINVFANMGIEAVVPYTDAEPNSYATRLAEQKGWQLMPLGGKSIGETFGNAYKIAKLAKFSGSDGILFGYGFLSEKPEAVQIAIDHGLIPLTPPPEAMRKTGNKVAAREAAKRVRIGRFRHMPVLDGSDHVLTEFPEVAAEAKRIGFPLRIKDPEGGGGHDNFSVSSEKDLETFYRTIRSNPNCKGVMVEKEIRNAAHVEVQLVGAKGKVVALGIRDCTIQRKGQKVIEKSWTQHLNTETQQALADAAVKHAEAVGLEGAFTSEFLVDKDTGGRKKASDWYYLVESHSLNEI